MTQKNQLLTVLSIKRAAPAWQGIFMSCHYRKATQVVGSGYKEISS